MTDIKKKSKLRFLIYGLGSIGERHYRILSKLTEKRPIIYRVKNNEPRTLNKDELEIYTELEEAFRNPIDAAIIANPTSLHIETAIELAKRNCHLLIEKPLGHNTNKADSLGNIINKNDLLLMVGYMMRFHPHIKKIKQIIESKSYGQIINYQSYWGEYLPEWHPWEDYRNSYAAKSGLGGGVIKTLSHDIDLALHLMGPLKLIDQKVDYHCPLPIEAEQICDLTYTDQNNRQIHIHLNYHDSPPKRWLKIVFEKAVVLFDYYTHSLKITDYNKEVLNFTLKNFSRDNLFEQELITFIDAIENKKRSPIPLSDGLKVLEAIGL